MVAKTRILVVDDDEAGRYAVARSLRQAGYEVLEAATAHRCLETTGRGQADIVLLDIKLPDLSGIEVCRQLKSNPATATIPIIQISALFTASHDRVAGLESGADAYLVSPVDPGELVAQVKVLLRVRDTEAALRESEQRLRLLADNLPDSGLYQYVLKPDGTRQFLYCSAGMERLNGVSAAELTRDAAVLYRMISPERLERLLAEELRSARDLTDFDLEVPLRRRDGQMRWMHLHSRPRRLPDGATIWDGVQTDVTERKAAEQERDAAVKFLGLINSSSDLRQLIGMTVDFFQREAGCQAVGVRIKQGDDYPYFQTRGFRAEFSRQEAFVREHVPARQTQPADNLMLGCICGKVILGRADPSIRFFTEGGTFWTNSRAELSGAIGSAEPQYQSRNRCCGEGYASIALIPLRAGGEDLGLVHLADERPGRFSPSLIAMCERLAGYLAVAIAKTSAEEALRDSRERLRLATVAARLFAFEWDPVSDAVRREGDAQQVLGVHFQEETGASFFARIDPADRARFVELMMSLRPGHEEYTTCYRVIRPDGRRAVLEESGRASFDDAGRFVRLIGMTADITERTRAEEALRRAHDTFRHLVEESPFGIYVVDSDFRLTQVSAGARKVFANVHPLLGRDFAEVMRCIWEEPFATQAIRRFRHTLETGEPYQATKTIERRRDILETESYDWKIERITLPDGRFGVVCHFYDLSLRQRFEAELQAHRELLETVVNNIPASVCLMRGTDLRLELVNPPYQAIAPAKPMVGKTLDELWPETGQNFSAICRQVLETGQSYQVHDELNMIRRRPDGPVEPSYFSWSLHRVRLPGSDGWGVLNTAWETTQRKLAEQALQESEQRLRLAKSAAHIGIHDFNPITGELHWDERLRALWELGPGDPVNYDVFISGIHPEDRDRTDAAVKQALDPSGDGYCYVEYRVIRGARPRWIAATGQATFHEGKAVRFVGTVQDITERREFQAELERLVTERTAKLHDLVGELEHLSYSITHDMRAPLRAMRGFAEVIRDLCASRPDPQLQVFLDRIIAAAERMDGLITDALNYTKAVRQELPIAPVILDRLLEGMLETYPEFLSQRACIRVAGKLPPVLGNEAALTQCFSNLVGNALKFVEPGQTPDVRIYAEQINTGLAGAAGDPLGSDWVRLWVEDKGIGINESMLPRVFDMFSRGTGTYQGTGIGLALVRKVVQRMGGRVGVESKLGKGTRFWVELRAAPRALVPSETGACCP